MLSKVNLNGNPFVGVFLSANDRFALCPPGLEEDIYGVVEDALDVEVLRLTFDGSRILGALSSINCRGGIFASFAREDDLSVLPDDFDWLLLPEKLNVAGNNILANDNGALVHPRFEDGLMEDISEVLGVPVERGTVGNGIKTVGSAAIATNRGVLVHPHTTEREMEIITRVMGVPATFGTANFGSPLLGACLVTNSKGALIGDKTTNIEVSRIEEGLGYLG